MHTLDLANVFTKLGSGPAGLASKEASTRLAKDGLNIIEERRATPLLLRFFAQFTDLMVLILIGASALSLLLNAWTDAVVILFTVVLNAVIGFVQEYKAERAIQALKKLVALHARVLRDGVEQEIDAEQLVVGDVVMLNAGDRVPADGRLLEVASLQTQEAVLTGESLPVAKDTRPLDEQHTTISNRTNCVFMGTDIAYGSGRAVVTATGMRTAFGRVAELAQTQEQDTSPLQRELLRIGKFIGKVVLVLAALFIIIAVGRGMGVLDSLIFAASVAVAAVPEGLPATITIALALGVQRLAQKRAIVRQLSSVETLGCTTVICTDKTGTLTKNEMTVSTIALPQVTPSPATSPQAASFLFGGVGYNPKGTVMLGGRKLALKELPIQLLTSLKVGALCNDSKFVIDQKQRSQHKYKIIGDPTEGALLVAAKKAGLNIHRFTSEYPRLATFPFDSNLKRMTTVHHTQREGLMAYSKGAPEAILELCNYAYVGSKRVKLDKKLEKQILAQNEVMARGALRVLAVAQRELSSFDANKHYRKDIEKGLTFLGLIGMIDPPRPEVAEAIRMAQQAGIRVIMVTGDHGATAQAIALQLGLAEPQKVRVVTGTELNKMSEQDLRLLLQQPDNQLVFARVDPEHKLKIVTALKAAEEIVAVTGDGVNDAPALKRADIGIAMGITGTDVSKEAANMVLADDSFASIVRAIKEGRAIYQNLRKFVFYVLSSNIGELITVFAAVVFALPLPLTAVLILLVNLGTDVLPALALGVDPVNPGIMTEPPRDQHKPLLSRNFIAHFLFLGSCIGLIVVATFIVTLAQGGWWFGEALTRESPLYLKASTSAFILLVLIQMVNAFNARSGSISIFRLGTLSNWYLWGAVTISILFTVAIAQTGVLQRLVHTTSLSLTEWLTLTLIALSILAIEELRKLVVKWIREAV